MVLGELVRVLDALDAEERAAQDHRRHEEHISTPALAGLRGVDRQRHRQAAGDEHRRVDGPEHDVERVARRGERVRIPAAIDGSSREQAAEEQHLGDQEHPHPERRRFLLLGEVVEVMRERGMVPLAVRGGRVPSQAT